MDLIVRLSISLHEQRFCVRFSYDQQDLMSDFLTWDIVISIISRELIEVNDDDDHRFFYYFILKTSLLAVAMLIPMMLKDSCIRR
jgi:hypothetical protein